MYCRNCGKELIGTPELCMNCGAQPMKGNSYCFSCGAQTNALAEICVKCGTKLVKANKKRNGKIIAAGILNIIAGILSIGAGVYIFSNGLLGLLFVFYLILGGTFMTITGITTFITKIWGLSLAASILATLSVSILLGLPSLILTATSKSDFAPKLNGIELQIKS